MFFVTLFTLSQISHICDEFSNVLSCKGLDPRWLCGFSGFFEGDLCSLHADLTLDNVIILEGGLGGRRVYYHRNKRR